MAIRTRAELTNLVDTLLADNAASGISAADIRNLLIDYADSLDVRASRRSDIRDDVDSLLADGRKIRSRDLRELFHLLLGATRTRDQVFVSPGGGGGVRMLGTYEVRLSSTDVATVDGLVLPADGVLGVHGAGTGIFWVEESDLISASELDPVQAFVGSVVVNSSVNLWEDGGQLKMVATFNIAPVNLMLTVIHIEAAEEADEDEGHEPDFDAFENVRMVANQARANATEALHLVRNALTGNVDMVARDAAASASALAATAQSAADGAAMTAALVLSRVPAGATDGQVLQATVAGADTTYGWADLPTELPSGATSGQILQATVAGSVTTLSWEDRPVGLPGGAANNQVLTSTIRNGMTGYTWAAANDAAARTAADTAQTAADSAAAAVANAQTAADRAVAAAATALARANAAAVTAATSQTAANNAVSEARSAQMDATTALTRVPEGTVDGQILQVSVMDSSATYAWVAKPLGVPSGGANGQVLSAQVRNTMTTHSWVAVNDSTARTAAANAATAASDAQTTASNATAAASTAQTAADAAAAAASTAQTTADGSATAASTAQTAADGAATAAAAAQTTADGAVTAASAAQRDATTALGRIPAGGTDGQVLIKSADANYALAWESVTAEYPSGATNGQVLQATVAGAVTTYGWADQPSDYLTQENVLDSNVTLSANNAGTASGVTIQADSWYRIRFADVGYTAFRGSDLIGAAIGASELMQFRSYGIGTGTMYWTDSDNELFARARGNADRTGQFVIERFWEVP